jgi:predicted anti-sigma-YlaC factor YlaD
MTEDRNNLSCHQFQEQMADLIATGEDVSNHPHLQNCANCRALLADLQTIAEAARQLFPVEQPKEDLWERIELAIKKEEGSTQPD